MVQTTLEQRSQKVLDDIDTSKKPDASYTEGMLQYRAFRLNPQDPKVTVAHRYAFALREDPLKREIMEALLLADASFDGILAVFDIPTDTSRIYKELFFDTAHFFTKLDRVVFGQSYAGPNNKETMVRAESLGPDYVYFKYGRLTPEADMQRSIVKKLFITSAYKAMEANFNSNLSDMSKASLEWSKQMLRTYEAIEQHANVGESSNAMTTYLMKKDPLQEETDAFDKVVNGGEIPTDSIV